METTTTTGPALETLEVYRQLRAAAYIGHLRDIRIEGTALRFTMSSFGREVLLDDARFLSGCGYLLHREVGTHLADRRSLDGAFGPGSLQIVIDRVTGEGYADVDACNPYADLVGFTRHNVAEVLWQRLKRLFRRGRDE